MMARPKKKEYWCELCGEGPWPAPQGLGGHTAGVHPGKKQKKKKVGRPKKKKVGRPKKKAKKKDDDFPPIEVEAIDSNGDAITIPIRIKIIVEVVT